MAKSENLKKAKQKKNNEFYTQLVDIENELKHYKNHFKDKIIYCNCDNPEWSNFWKYFKDNFQTLGLKKLVSTYYEEQNLFTQSVVYKTIYDGINEIKEPLKGDGDFRSQECIELLKEADIVVTNPPFSLFRKYIALLMEYDKKFLIIGNQNALSYKEIFPLIKNNKMWWGACDCIRWFIIPDYVDMKYKLNNYGEHIAEGARSRWWTNLDHHKRHKKLTLWKNYTPEEYPKYDNYDAIEVSKVSDIPMDYDGVMGVPITFLDKYNPEQFEIIGHTHSGDTTAEVNTLRLDMCNKHRGLINGKQIYGRILIRKKSGTEKPNI